MRTGRRILFVLLIVAAVVLAVVRCGHNDTHPDAAHPTAPAANTAPDSTHPASPPAQSSTTTAPSTSASPQPPGLFDGVDRTNPRAVISAVTKTVFSYQPGDSTQADAARRAQPLLATKVDDSYAVLAPITGAQWRQWMSAGDRIVADVIVPGGNDNPDGPDTVSRIIAVTQHVLDPQGVPTGEDIRITVFASADKQTDGTWKVAHISVQA